MIHLYKNPKWFGGLEVGIHNECFADTDDETYIHSITKPYFERVNAVVIHSAMLYIIEKVWPNTTVLATSKSERDGESHPVFWTNQYGKGRVFGTTYGHSKDTFSDKAFLETVINGIVWAGGR